MPKFVAFLRAINVGGHLVKMDQLRSLLEELGFVNVETFIASGNVIFESRAGATAPLERKIERVLRDGLGGRAAVRVERGERGRGAVQPRRVVEQPALAAHPLIERRARKRREDGEFSKIQVA